MTVLLPLPLPASSFGSGSGSKRHAAPQQHRDTGGFGEVPRDVELGLIRVGMAIRDAKRIVVIAGAGISTPAIPDFRSSTGLFKTLRTTAAADLGRTRLRSRARAEKTSLKGSGMGAAGIRSGKDLFDVKCLSSPTLLPHHHALLTSLHRLSSATEPTAFHRLLKTLDTQSRLLRVYTQNIDGLEGKVGLDCRIPDLPERKTTSRRRKDTSKRVQGSGLLESQASMVSTMTTASDAGRPSWTPFSNTMWATKDRAARVSLARRFLEAIDPDFAPTWETGPVLDDLDRTDNEDDLEQIDAAVCSARHQSATNSPHVQRAALAKQAGHDAHSVASASDLAERRSVGYSTASEQGRAAIDATLEMMPASQTATEVPLSQAYSTRSPSPEPGTDNERPPAPAPRCVPLHGLLDDLHCTLCSHSVPLESQLPLPADIIPCPSCQSHQEERIEKSVRARSIGTMRAGVVLYGEEHRHGEAIGAVVEKDIKGNKDDGRIDLLIVAGTTLHIPGVKRIIKEFSHVLKRRSQPRKKGGRKPLGAGEQRQEDEEQDNDDSDFPIRTVFLNMDPPGKGKGGEWADMFDVWVQGDLQAFVEEWVNKPRELPGQPKATTPARPSKRASGPATPRPLKKQISLSEPVPLTGPSSPNPFVTKTGNLKFVIKKPSPEQSPSKKRKRDQETPQKSKSGRAIKPSAKVESLKKRRRLQQEADPATLAKLLAVRRDGPACLASLLNAGQSRLPRRPRKSDQSRRQYTREDTPCPTSDLSSDLTELTPSPSPSPSPPRSRRTTPFAYAYSSPSRQQQADIFDADSPLTDLDLSAPPPAAGDQAGQTLAVPADSPTLSSGKMDILTLLNPQSAPATQVEAPRTAISISADDERPWFIPSGLAGMTKRPIEPTDPIEADNRELSPPPWLAEGSDARLSAGVTGFFAASKMGSSPIGKASMPVRRQPAAQSRIIAF